MFLLAFLGVDLMIILACTKKDFIKYVDDKTISNKVYDAYKDTFNKKTKSWVL